MANIPPVPTFSVIWLWSKAPYSLLSIIQWAFLARFDVCTYCWQTLLQNKQIHQIRWFTKLSFLWSMYEMYFSSTLHIVNRQAYLSYPGSMEAQYKSDCARFLEVSPGMLAKVIELQCLWQSREGDREIFPQTSSSIMHPWPAAVTVWLYLLMWGDN